MRFAGPIKRPTRLDRPGKNIECPAEPDLLFRFGLLFALFSLFRFLGLLAFVLLLIFPKLRGELVAALVALAAKAQRAASGAFWRSRFFQQKLKEHQTPAVADAMVG